MKRFETILLVLFLVSSSIIWIQWVFFDQQFDNMDIFNGILVLIWLFNRVVERNSTC